jgi:hypothetical protein
LFSESCDTYSATAFSISWRLASARASAPAAAASPLNFAGSAKPTALIVSTPGSDAAATDRRCARTGCAELRRRGGDRSGLARTLGDGGAIAFLSAHQVHPPPTNDTEDTRCAGEERYRLLARRRG